jgi:hypothetical protein
LIPPKSPNSSRGLLQEVGDAADSSSWAEEAEAQREAPLHLARGPRREAVGMGGHGLRRPCTKLHLLARSNIDQCQVSGKAASGQTDAGRMRHCDPHDDDRSATGRAAGLERATAERKPDRPAVAMRGE